MSSNTHFKTISNAEFKDWFDESRLDIINKLDNLVRASNKFSDDPNRLNTITSSIYELAEVEKSPLIYGDMVDLFHISSPSKYGYKVLVSRELTVEEYIQYNRGGFVTTSTVKMLTNLSRVVEEDFFLIITHVSSIDYSYSNSRCLNHVNDVRDIRLKNRSILSKNYTRLIDKINSIVASYEFAKTKNITHILNSLIADLIFNAIENKIGSTTLSASEVGMTDLHKGSVCCIYETLSTSGGIRSTIRIKDAIIPADIVQIGLTSGFNHRTMFSVYDDSSKTIRSFFLEFIITS